MNDLTRLEERFRMANPVPDPAEPPMTARTAATALLDLDERRGTMQTRQTTPHTASTKRSRLAAAGVAFAVVIAAVAAALVIASLGGDDPDNEPAAPPSITMFVGTPTVTFDGSSCVYQGPIEFKFGEPRTFKFVNASSERFRGSSSKLNQDGQNRDQVNADMLGLVTGISLGRDLDAGGTVEFSGAPGAPVPDEIGTWVLACEPVWPNDGFSGVAAVYEVIP